MSSAELPELTEENFERLGERACATFAFRAAARVMPLIVASRGDLSFWEIFDREKHLAAVVAALDVSGISALNSNVSILLKYNI